MLSLNIIGNKQSIESLKVTITSFQSVYGQLRKLDGERK